jgi:hypothetical protein
MYWRKQRRKAKQDASGTVQAFGYNVSSRRHYYYQYSRLILGGVYAQAVDLPIGLVKSGGVIIDN